MVSKRKFNKIKKENPDSRIGKRTWEEQNARNELATVLIKARKKGVKTPIDKHIDEKIKLKQENMELKKENKALQETIFELKPHFFEKINFNSGIDDAKFHELQNADLVLVYRDNDLYGDMSLALKDLIEHKYCGNVYCVSIPQGTENLSDSEIEIIKQILTKCKCMTDYTISRWTGIKSEYIPERHSSDIQRFLGIIKSLEENFIKGGINKVYIFKSKKVKYPDGETGIQYTVFDHGHMCQREDGTIYFREGADFRSHEKKDKEYVEKSLEDAKRFWENMFSNLDVEFIDLDLTNGEDGSKYNKEGSVLIADRHANASVNGFSGQKIFYAGDGFEPDGGIEKFVDESDYKYIGSAGEAIAETIMLDNFGSGDKPER